MNFKKYFLTSIGILISMTIYSQKESGYYMNWNRDHTERTVKPTIKLNEKEFKFLNCYSVTFDLADKLTKVEYYTAGKKNSNADFGAHKLEVNYYSNYYEEVFRNEENQRVVNKNGIWLIKYHINEDGYWMKRAYYDKDGNLINRYGVAISKVQRDYMNRMISEIQLNSNLDTIPDVNGFKIPHFTFNQDGFMSSRQNRNENGKLENGKYGYAKVIFHLDQNGQFYGEEFIDSQDNLINSSSLGYAKVDLRDFNEYGKNKRLYYTDETGYASEHKAMGIITYNENMTRDEIVYYDRYGKMTNDVSVRAKSKFIYNENGEFVGRENYNCEGKIIE